MITNGKYYICIKYIYLLQKSQMPVYKFPTFLLFTPVISP